MASHSLTITTTNRQELALTRARERYNADNPTATFANNDLYLQAIVDRAIITYVQAHKEATGERLRDAYESASGAVQNQVNSALGITP